MKFLTLLIFIGFYSCQSDSKELPVLSYKINDEGEKVNYLVTYKNFTNQLNDPFSTNHIKNKVFIANFFFTRCPSICPPMRRELIGIAKSFKSRDDFMIISHTIDPENDSIEVLKTYSETTEIPSKKWQFVRSSELNTKKQANQYMTNFNPNEDGTDFYHSSYVVLVDKNQQIRGFYNILVVEEVKRLKKDVEILLTN
jgi:protein SCO1/2